MRHGQLAVLLGLVLAGPIAGQDTDRRTSPPPDTRLHGTVEDLNTGHPLPGAFVAPQGSRTGFLTDSLGRFVLDLPTAPRYYLYVERLGYHTTRLELPGEDAGRPLEVRVRPDPVLLEGVEVLADRWERRRRFYSGSVATFDQRDLLKAGTNDALTFIRGRSGARVRPCRGDPLSYCVWRRGRLLRMAVCLDEMPLFDGGRALQSFHPQDFYMIEVYDRGMQVRLYTEHFVEQSARRGSPVRPLILGQRSDMITGC